MPRQKNIGITPSAFQQLARSYQRRWHIGLIAVDPQGNIIYRSKSADSAILSNDSIQLQIRRQAVEESFRWGEPTVQMAMGNSLVWAVPLMHNAQVTGGLLASIPERRLFRQRSDASTLDIRSACTNLRCLAEEHNLTNAAFLESQRRNYHQEQLKAEGIHAHKQIQRSHINEIHLLDEPALLAAIRRGDRPAARAILNRLLTALLSYAQDRFELVKSFFMELVVTMHRMAVQAGGASRELLGVNYVNIADLSRIETEEALAPWLSQMLERLMDAIAQHPENDPTAAPMAAALDFMAAHFAQPISRQDAAKAAHLSPPHFSRVFKRRTGQTFTSSLNQLRIDHACQLLTCSHQGLGEIALACGFEDQSYFTKVFRRHTGLTPLIYRQRGQTTPSPAAHKMTKD